MSLPRELSPVEVRILGCLIEKQATTPDQYPLTLNSLTTACNQKSSRHPVTSYEIGEIGHALRQLGDLRLVSESRASRAAKYEHHFAEVVQVLKKELAVLCVLMLRGAQTPGEVRTRCQRIHEFDDLDDVVYVLDRLIEREPALVQRVPRGAGQKDDRYVHLLSGEPSAELLAAPAASATSAGARSLLAQQVADLTERVEALEEQLARLGPRPMD
ncbi:MAG: YceH family protein [Pseudomonadota bacterium]